MSLVPKISKSLFATTCALILTLIPGLAQDPVLDAVDRSVVRVQTLTEQGTGHGTGFVLTEDGHIATNHHVIDQSEVILVIYNTGDEVEVREAEIIRTDSRRDLAILKVDSISASPVELHSYEIPRRHKVNAAGFPGALDDNEKVLEAILTIVSEGSLPQNLDLTDDAIAISEESAFDGSVGKVQRMPWEEGAREILIIEHSAKTSGGNSGGPLFNECGGVIGINTQIMIGTGAADTGRSSHIQEMISLAEQEGLKLNVKTEPCTIGAVATSAGGGLFSNSKHLMLLIVLALLTLIALYLSLKKPKVVTETISQYLGRGGTMSRLQRESGGGSKPSTPSRPTPARESPKPKSVSSWSLRGASPDGGTYDVSFNEDELKRSGGKLIIGRNRDLVDIHISHDTVSRQHAAIIRPAGKTSLYLEDRTSGRNIISVNGIELDADTAALKLKEGSEVVLGEVELKFQTD